MTFKHNDFFSFVHINTNLFAPVYTPCTVTYGKRQYHCAVVYQVVESESSLHHLIVIIVHL